MNKKTEFRVVIQTETLKGNEVHDRLMGNLNQMVRKAIYQDSSFQWLGTVDVTQIEEGKSMPHQDRMLDQGISIGYIAKAFAHYGFQDIVADTDLGGEIEVMCIAVKYGIMADTLLAEMIDKGHEYNGVFDYEVTEPFGAWLAGQIVSDANGFDKVAEIELKRRVDEFFHVKVEDVKQVVVLEGDLVPCYKVHGPFASMAEAIDWAERKVGNPESWNVIELEPLK